MYSPVVIENDGRGERSYDIYSRLLKFASKDRKNYIYFKCKNCKQELRIPRGKGKIKVICPHCKHEEIKKS